MVGWTDVIVLNIFIPVLVLPALGPTIFSVITLSFRSVPETVKLFKVSSPSEEIEILVPEKVVLEFIPFKVKLTLAVPCWDNAIEFWIVLDVSSNIALTLFCSGPSTINSSASTLIVYFCPSNITSNFESSAGILLITEPSSFDVGDCCLILFNNSDEISADVDKFDSAASILASQKLSAAIVPIFIEPDVLLAIVTDVILLNIWLPFDKVPLVPWIFSLITSPSKS